MPSRQTAASTFEGFLRLSENGEYATMAGANENAGLANIDSSIAPTTIALISNTGTNTYGVDLSTQDTSLSGAERDGAVTPDGTTFYDWGYTGAAVAISNVAQFGQTQSNTPLQSTYVAFRGFEEQDGEVDGSADAAPFANKPGDIAQVGAVTKWTSAISQGNGVYQVTPASMTGIDQGEMLLVDTGTNAEFVTVSSTTSTTFTATFANTHNANAPILVVLPNSAGQTSNPLPGLPDNGTTNEKTSAWQFLKENPNVAGPDTLYIADQTSGLQKFSFDGTNWYLDWSFKPTVSGSTTALDGLVVIPGDNGTATIYATTLSQKSVVEIVDPGTGAPTAANVTVLSVAPGSGDTFGDISMAPYAAANTTSTTVSANYPVSTSSQTVTLTAAVDGLSSTSTPGTAGNEAGDTVTFTVVRGTSIYYSNAVAVTPSTALGSGTAVVTVNGTNFTTLPGGALANGDVISATFTPGGSSVFSGSTSPSFTESVVSASTTTGLALTTGTNPTTLGTASPTPLPSPGPRLQRGR